MTRFKHGLVAILLASSLILAAAQVYADVPRLCSFVGCSVGPDTCMIITVGIGPRQFSMICYTRVPTTR